MSRDDADRERWREKIRRLCAERRIRITAYGVGVRLVGVGVDILTADLSFISPRELTDARYLSTAELAQHLR